MDHSSYFSFSADTPRNSLHSLDDHRPGVLTPASREQSRLTCTPCCSCQPPDAWADPHTCKGSNRSQAPAPRRHCEHDSAFSYLGRDSVGAGSMPTHLRISP